MLVSFPYVLSAVMHMCCVVGSCLEELMSLSTSAEIEVFMKKWLHNAADCMHGPSAWMPNAAEKSRPAEMQV